jgi:hypothetical protein
MSSYQISTDANGTFDVLSGQINTSQTSLKLVGRGAAGYGYAIAENTIKHLSNFAGVNQPANPLKGQLWFDTSVQCLKVYVNATAGWAEVPVAGFSSKFVTRDELYGAGGNSTSPLTVSKGGTGLTTVGPSGQVLTSDGTKIVWQSPQAALLASAGGATAGQVLTYNGTAVVWAGTSAGTNALRTDLSTFPVNDASISLGTSAKRFNDVYAVTFRGTAIQAQYADVAERYAADHPMTPGDLVDIGGEKDITLTTKSWQSAFGVISTAPAFKMNSEAGDDITHPYVALIGRVPVKVIGQVAKGDRLTASDIPGVAMSAGKDNHPGVFGRALNDKTTDELGFVEVALGAK